MNDTRTLPPQALPEPPGTRSAAGQVEIEATAERVWQALTRAEELERWFPLDAKVKPGPGGSIWMSWRNEYAGDMKIQVWDPPRHLRTAWSFHEGEETGQVTDYLLEARGGSTVVRAVTSGFPMDPSWDGWVEGTRRGWAFELRSLKHYLEHHAGQPRHVVYLRRRVPLSRADAWARLAREPELIPWMVQGEVFDREHAHQVAAVVHEPADGLFRVSVEPGAPGVDQVEVVLWLSGWGAVEARLREIEAQWAALLARVFPDGTTP